MKSIQISTIVAAIVLSACLWIADVQAGGDGKANVVLLNGKIYTADRARSVKQAVAISGNTILAVDNDAEMKGLIGPNTKIIDLDGKLVLPGLIDTHVHPIIGAVNGSKCGLAG